MVNGKVNGSAEKGRSFLKHPCETPRRSGVRCLSIILYGNWASGCHTQLRSMSMCGIVVYGVFYVIGRLSGTEQELSKYD